MERKNNQNPEAIENPYEGYEFIGTFTYNIFRIANPASDFHLLYGEPSADEWARWRAEKIFKKQGKELTEEIEVIAGPVPSKKKKYVDEGTQYGIYIREIK